MNKRTVIALLIFAWALFDLGVLYSVKGHDPVIFNIIMTTMNLFSLTALIICIVLMRRK